MKTLNLISAGIFFTGALTLSGCIKYQDCKSFEAYFSKATKKNAEGKNKIPYEKTNAILPERIYAGKFSEVKFRE